MLLAACVYDLEELIPVSLLVTYLGIKMMSKQHPEVGLSLKMYLGDVKMTFCTLKMYLGDVKMTFCTMICFPCTYVFL